MAIHIFNISVDSPDPEPAYLPEDLSFNDMESIAEIILEEVLGITNAINEQDEPDENGGANFEMKKLEIPFKQFCCHHLNPLLIMNADYFKSYNLAYFYSSTIFEVLTPPPQV